MDPVAPNGLALPKPLRCFGPDDEAGLPHLAQSWPGRRLKVKQAAVKSCVRSAGHDGGVGFRLIRADYFDARPDGPPQVGTEYFGARYPWEETRPTMGALRRELSARGG